MSTSPGASVLGLAAACVLATACRGQVVKGSPGPPPAACDHYFDATFGIACNLPSTLPPAIVAHDRARYDLACQEMLALPDTSLTVAQVDACASAIVAAGCVYLTLPSACDPLPGGRPDGAACDESAQCQSADCLETYTPVGSLNDGAIEEVAPTGCGICVSAVLTGQPCDESGLGAPCETGATCVLADGATMATCETITYVDAGGNCVAGPPVQCAPGLYCDATLQCAAQTGPGGAGTPCSSSYECTPGLLCSPPGVCAVPVQVGGSCADVVSCAAGLGCDPATEECAPVTVANPGEPCGGLTVCLVGSCPYGEAQAICPTVIPDGQPCSEAANSQTTCDYFALCEAGFCDNGNVACN